jgi:hypothetical protein
MASRGNEPVYVQMWLIDLLSSDPYLQASIVEGRVYEQPVDASALPAIVIAVTPDQIPSETQSRIRNMIEVVVSIAPTMAGENLLPLLPVADRIDVILSRHGRNGGNVPWSSPDIEGLPNDDPYNQELTVYSVARSLSMPETPSEGDQIFRSINQEWRIRCSVALSGDVVA